MRERTLRASFGPECKRRQQPLVITLEPVLGSM
jgi:hypothetical protein